MAVEAPRNMDQQTVMRSKRTERQAMTEKVKHPTNIRNGEQTSRIGVRGSITSTASNKRSAVRTEQDGQSERGTRNVTHIVGKFVRQMHHEPERPHSRVDGTKSKIQSLGVTQVRGHKNRRQGFPSLAAGGQKMPVLSK